jgi:nicotinate-nucleotide adenylyltransferase
MIGIFGGTFNPIHFGHLRPALEIVEALELRQMRFIPSAVPPHREAPKVSAQWRCNMAAAAVASEPSFVVDDRELKREGPSFSVDTLASLREELGDEPMVMAIGMDAFIQLHTWHRWRELLDFAHFVIMHRPGEPNDTGLKERLDSAVKTILEERLVRQPARLHEHRAGKLLIQEVSQLQISATAIRAAIRAGRSARYLTPDPVLEMIADNHLYSE